MCSKSQSPCEFWLAQRTLPWQFSIGAGASGYAGPGCRAPSLSNSVPGFRVSAFRASILRARNIEPCAALARPRQHAHHRDLFAGHRRRGARDRREDVEKLYRVTFQIYCFAKRQRHVIDHAWALRHAVPQAISARSGHDRSAKTIGGIRRPASITQIIRTGATISPACCTAAAASTYIPSSANGSDQNPAYSWQLGSKMDGTRPDRSFLPPMSANQRRRLKHPNLLHRMCREPSREIRCANGGSRPRGSAKSVSGSPLSRGRAV
jgi:hypothetical protein